VTYVAGVFALTAFGVLLFFGQIEWKATRSYFFSEELGFGLWLTLTAGLATSGWLGDFDARPPHFLMWIAVALGLTVAHALTRFGADVADRIGWGALIGFQVFRVPVEWVLLELARAGVAPPQMTLEGWNFDVLTGVTAPLVAWLAATGRIGARGIAFWNAAGLALLTNVVTIAILSAPTPLRVFMNEPANTFVAQLPWCYLPGLLVPSALFGHLVVFRKLRRMR
jgi:hypothetical protein